MTEEISSSKQELKGNNSIRQLKSVFTPPNLVKVTFDLHEGNDHPNLSFTLKDANGEGLAQSFIINCTDLHMDFTLHIRKLEIIFPLTLHCATFIEDDQPIDQEDIILDR